MKKCSECSGVMREFQAKTPENVTYSYYRCGSCGNEIVDMSQLHAVAEKYRVMKKYSAKVSKWGLSLGIRIPKELVKKYKFKDEKEVTIIPERKGIRVIPS